MVSSCEFCAGVWTRAPHATEPLPQYTDAGCGWMLWLTYAFEKGFFHALSSCPARAAARGDRAPCTPGPELRPWEPQFYAWVCQALGAHADGQIGAGNSECMFWHYRSMRRCLNRAASINCRGSGGGSPAQRGARGAEPPRIQCTKRRCNCGQVSMVQCGA